MRKYSGGNQNLDTELNLVPIIDCFVMLICFLLFTAAFTQLVYLEAKITQTTAQAIAKSRDEVNKFQLEVKVNATSLELITKGSDVGNTSHTLANLPDGSYDAMALHDKVIAIKTAHPSRFSVDIIVNSKDVQYEHLLKIMDAVRHLSEDEYKGVRITSKRVKEMELLENEKNVQVAEHLIALAQSQLNDQIAVNTDRKLLFPDIALVGLY